MLIEKLIRLKNEIEIGIIGIGSAGKGLFYQSLLTPGIKCTAISDIKIEKAINAARSFNIPYKTVDNLSLLNDTISKGILAVCEDATLIAQNDSLKAVFDASNAIESAADFDTEILNNGKHLIMMNAEADLIFGPYLQDLANQHGVVYTSCDGDQPAVIRRLVSEIELWGFELVMAGNMKGFLDRYANPTSIIPEADKRDLDYEMCTSYTDGTKLCIEMAIVANALNLKTHITGMHGPCTKKVLGALDVFDLSDIWKDKRPVVDFILGAQPSGGVFVIGYSDSKYQQHMLNWYPSDIGKGPFYVFHRPYHLIHLEGMMTAAETVLDGTSLLSPKFGFKCNVYCYAKNNLKKGEKLDGLGGYTCYGLIENITENNDKMGVPICISKGAVLKKDVNKDEKLFMDDVAIDLNRSDLKIYQKSMEVSK